MKKILFNLFKEKRLLNVRSPDKEDPEPALVAEKVKIPEVVPEKRPDAEIPKRISDANKDDIDDEEDLQIHWAEELEKRYSNLKTTLEGITKDEGSYTQGFRDNATKFLTDTKETYEKVKTDAGRWEISLFFLELDKNDMRAFEETLDDFESRYSEEEIAGNKEANKEIREANEYKTKEVDPSIETVNGWIDENVSDKEQKNLYKESFKRIFDTQATLINNIGSNIQTAWTHRGKTTELMKTLDNSKARLKGIDRFLQSYFVGIIAYNKKIDPLLENPKYGEKGLCEKVKAKFQTDQKKIFKSPEVAGNPSTLPRKADAEKVINTDYGTAAEVTTAADSILKNYPEKFKKVSEIQALLTKEAGRTTGLGKRVMDMINADAEKVINTDYGTAAEVTKAADSILKNYPEILKAVDEVYVKLTKASGQNATNFINATILDDMRLALVALNKRSGIITEADVKAITAEKTAILLKHAPGLELAHLQDIVGKGATVENIKIAIGLIGKKPNKKQNPEITRILAELGKEPAKAIVAKYNAAVGAVEQATEIIFTDKTGDSLNGFDYARDDVTKNWHAANKAFAESLGIKNYEEGPFMEVVKDIQRKLGVHDDGLIGPITMAAMEKHKEEYSATAIEGQIKFNPTVTLARVKAEKEAAEKAAAAKAAAKASKGRLS